jgi:hypothetical protein
MKSSEVIKLDSYQSFLAVAKTILMLMELFTHSETGWGDFFSKKTRKTHAAASETGNL